MGYKSGRISQLIGATRPSSSSGLKRPAAATEALEDTAPTAAAPKRRVRGKQTVPAYDLPGPVEEPEEQAAPRPARPNEQCLGLPPSVCIFSTRVANERAQVDRKGTDGRQCAFCSANRFEKAMENPRGKGFVTTALAFFQEHNEETFALACERIKSFTDDGTLEQCLGRLGRLQKRGLTQEVRGRTAREKKKEREEAQHNNTWQHLLRKWNPQLGLKREEVKKYKEGTQKNALLPSLSRAHWSQDARRQARRRAARQWDQEDEEDWYLQAEEAGEPMADEAGATAQKKSLMLGN